MSVSDNWCKDTVKITGNIKENIQKMSEVSPLDGINSTNPLIPGGNKKFTHT